jgi:hypothetical protein
MAEIDSVRVFRGIYAGLALAMSETEEDINFAALPSSDEIAHSAFELCAQVIGNDSRTSVRGAQQELTGMAVVLAVLERDGGSDGLNAEVVAGGLHGLWRLIGRGWDGAPVTSA